MANFGEMAVALQLSRHRLENDAIKLRKLCKTVGLSDMGTELAVGDFEQDLTRVDEAALILRELSRYESDVLDLIARKNRRADGLLSRIMSTVSAVML